MSSLNRSEPSPLITSPGAAGDPHPQSLYENDLPNEPPRSTRSPIEWFLHAFLQQQNIKWLAVIGAAIVIASSLMLVSREWSNWNESIKFLVILGYTGLIYLFSEFGRKSLGLQVTSRVLQVLTILLLPLTFLALGWFLQNQSESSLSYVSTGLLAIPGLALTWFAASRIFHELWRGKQTTYLACYIALSLLGMLPGIPASQPWLAVGMVLFYWMLATVGSIKINRHIFWMSEQHRLPRVFGFLPMALLGLQFIALAAMKAGASIQIEWLGVILVLAASTILLGTREHSIVHRQRTGGLLHPMPWSLIVPILMSMLLVAIGVLSGIHGYSIRPQSGQALVLSAALGACLLFAVAKEVQGKIFFWGGLLLTLIAYQVSPTLVHGLVATIRDHAASAVGETKLPVGFYGLSYLPLLVGLALMGAYFDRRQHQLFADPIRQGVTLLTLLLALLSGMHIKSLVMVACVNVFWLSALAYLFRDRRYAWLAMISMTLIAGGWVLFAEEMGWLSLSRYWALVSTAMLAGILGASDRMDRMLQNIPQREGHTPVISMASQGHPLRWMRIYGAMLTLATLIAWILMWSAQLQSGALAYPRTWHAPLHLAPFYLSIGLVIANVSYLSLRFRSYLGSLFAWVLLGFTIGQGLYFETNWSWIEVLNNLVPTLVIAALGAKWLLRNQHRPSSSQASIESKARSFFYLDASAAATHDDSVTKRAVALFPLVDLCYLCLASVLLLWIMPWILAVHVGLQLQLGWVALILTLALLTDALMFENRYSAVLFTCISPFVVSGILIHGKMMTMGLDQVIAAWLIASSFSYACLRLKPRLHVACLIAQIGLCAMLLLSLISLSWFVRLASLSSVLLFVFYEKNRLERGHWAIMAIVANIHIFALILRCFVPSWENWVTSGWSNPLLNAAMMSAIAISVHVWSNYGMRLHEGYGRFWRAAMRMGFVGMMLTSLLWNAPGPMGLTPFLIGMIVGIVVEVLEGIRQQKESYVWSSFVLIGIALGWTILQAQSHFTILQVQFVLLGLSLIGLTATGFLRQRTRLAILANPLERVAIAAPGIVCVLTLASFIQRDFRSSAWDSLMLFAAAAIYFHVAIRTKKMVYWLASAAIMNTGLVILWVSLRLNDAQFYMVPIGLTLIGLVELLKRELPHTLRDPVRYLGAIVILASPMWEIIGGSWLHLFTLLLLSLLVICLSIGLRLKALIYTGMGFLAIDLVSMVVHSAVAHPGLLWVVGLAMGVGVIALAAVCENKREQLLSRIRLLSAELATWN